MSISYNIAVLPGDGIGSEIVNEGLKALKAASKKNGIQLNITTSGFGGEHYKKTGESLPQSVLEEFKDFNAIYVGAVATRKTFSVINKQEKLFGRSTPNITTF